MSESQKVSYGVPAASSNLPPHATVAVGRVEIEVELDDEEEVLVVIVVVCRGMS